MMTPDRIFIHFFSAQYPVRCLMCVCVFVCLLFSNFFLVFFLIWLIKIFKNFSGLNLFTFIIGVWCWWYFLFFIFFWFDSEWPNHFLIWDWLIDWINRNSRWYWNSTNKKRDYFLCFFFRFNLCQLLWWFSTTTTTTA